MLYDGALKYLHQARDKMLANDFAAKGMLISRVIDIVNRAGRLPEYGQGRQSCP